MPCRAGCGGAWFTRMDQGGRLSRGFSRVIGLSGFGFWVRPKTQPILVRAPCRTLVVKIGSMEQPSGCLLEFRDQGGTRRAVAFVSTPLHQDGAGSGAQDCGEVWLRLLRRVPNSKTRNPKPQTLNPKPRP